MLLVAQAEVQYRSRFEESRQQTAILQRLQPKFSGPRAVIETGVGAITLLGAAKEREAGKHGRILGKGGGLGSGISGPEQDGATSCRCVIGNRLATHFYDEINCPQGREPTRANILAWLGGRPRRNPLSAQITLANNPCQRGP